MKRLACCLFALAALLPTAPLSAAPDRYEKKEAAAWVKEDIARLTKTCALLKRVKDVKSAEKSAGALLEMYEFESEKTAMGETGPAQKPAGEAMDGAELRNRARYEKLWSAIREQMLRIEALELESSSLERAMQLVGKAIPAATEP